MESVRRFVGMRLSDPQPDESTVLHFRRLLDRHGLGQGLFQEIHHHPEDRGLRLRLREGTAAGGNDGGRERRREGTTAGGNDGGRERRREGTTAGGNDSGRDHHRGAVVNEESGWRP